MFKKYLYLVLSFSMSCAVGLHAATHSRKGLHTPQQAENNSIDAKRSADSSGPSLFSLHQSEESKKQIAQAQVTLEVRRAGVSEEEIDNNLKAAENAPSTSVTVSTLQSAPAENIQGFDEDGYDEKVAADAAEAKLKEENAQNIEVLVTVDGVDMPIWYKENSDGSYTSCVGGEHPLSKDGQKLFIPKKLVPCLELISRMIDSSDKDKPAFVIGKDNLLKKITHLEEKIVRFIKILEKFYLEESGSRDWLKEKLIKMPTQDLLSFLIFCDYCVVDQVTNLLLSKYGSSILLVDVLKEKSIKDGFGKTFDELKKIENLLTDPRYKKSLIELSPLKYTKIAEGLPWDCCAAWSSRGHLAVANQKSNETRLYATTDSGKLQLVDIVRQSRLIFHDFTSMTWSYDGTMLAVTGGTKNDKYGVSCVLLYKINNNKLTQVGMQSINSNSDSVSSILGQPTSNPQGIFSARIVDRTSECCVVVDQLLTGKQCHIYCSRWEQVFCEPINGNMVIVRAGDILSVWRRNEYTSCTIIQLLGLCVCQEFFLHYKDDDVKYIQDRKNYLRHVLKLDEKNIPSRGNVFLEKADLLESRTLWARIKPYAYVATALTLVALAKWWWGKKAITQ